MELISDGGLFPSLTDCDRTSYFSTLRFCSQGSRRFYVCKDTEEVLQAEMDFRCFGFLRAVLMTGGIWYGPFVRP